MLLKANSIHDHAGVDNLHDAENAADAATNDGVRDGVNRSIIYVITCDVSCWLLFRSQWRCRDNKANGRDVGHPASSSIILYHDQHRHLVRRDGRIQIRCSSNNDHLAPSGPQRVFIVVAITSTSRPGETKAQHGGGNTRRITALPY